MFIPTCKYTVSKEVYTERPWDMSLIIPHLYLNVHTVARYIDIGCASYIFPVTFKQN